MANENNDTTLAAELAKLRAELAEYKKAKKEIDDTETADLSLDAFYESIKHIAKVSGMCAEDGAKWKITHEIFEKTKTIEIGNRKLMAGPTEYAHLFKSAFGLWLPYELTKKPEKNEKPRWIKFQTWLEERVDEYVEPDECTEWIECDIILSALASFDVTEDKEAWNDTTKNVECMLKTSAEGNDYYCIKTGQMAALMKAKNITTPIGNFGKALIKRNLKREKNHKIRIGTKRPDAWWFRCGPIDELRGNGGGRGVRSTITDVEQHCLDTDEVY